MIQTHIENLFWRETKGTDPELSEQGTWEALTAPLINVLGYGREGYGIKKIYNRQNQYRFEERNEPPFEYEDRPQQTGKVNGIEEITFETVPEYSDPKIDQRIFTIFEAAKGPFLLVTNGKIVRIYCKGQKALHSISIFETNLLKNVQEEIETLMEFSKEKFNRQNLFQKFNIQNTDMSIQPESEETLQTGAAEELPKTQDTLQPEKNVTNKILEELVKILNNPDPEFLLFLKNRIQPLEQEGQEDAKKELPKISDEEFKHKVRESIYSLQLMMASAVMVEKAKINLQGIQWKLVNQADISTNAIQFRTEPNPQPEPEPEKEPADENEVALGLIQKMLSGYVDKSRIVRRDNQTYVGVLLDDNNRKTLCRLYLRGSKPAVAFLNEERKEERTAITSLEDIPGLKTQFLHVLKNYGVVIDNEETSKESPEEENEAE